MLGPGRYLLGITEIALLVGFAWLAASRVRSRLVPRLEGAPAHLATAVLALALLVWMAELLGTVSLFEPVPYLVAVVGVGLALRVTIQEAPTTPSASDVVGASWIVTAGALVVAVIAAIHFAGGVETRLGTGMTGFDSHLVPRAVRGGVLPEREYLGPALHRAAVPGLVLPGERGNLHGVGMLAFGRDVLSPLLNLGWFVGCLAPAGASGGRTGWRRGRWPLERSRSASRRCRIRRERRGTTSSGSSSCSRRWLSRSTAGWVGGRGSGRCRLARSLSSGSRRDLPPGRSSTSCSRRLSWCSGWERSRRAERERAHSASRPWRRWPVAATGTCAISFTPATRCPGSTTSARSHCRRPTRHWAAAKLTASSAISPTAAVWSDWFLPGLHDGLWILWPLLLVAALAGPGPLPQVRPLSPCSRVAGAGRPRRRARLAGRTDLRLRPGGHAPRLRVRPALPRPGPRPRPRFAARDASLALTPVGGAIVLWDA